MNQITIGAKQAETTLKELRDSLEGLQYSNSHLKAIDEIIYKIRIETTNSEFNNLSLSGLMLSLVTRMIGATKEGR